MSDYTLAEATELLTEAKAQVLDLTKKLATQSYTVAGRNLQRQQLVAAREHLEWVRELYNSLAGNTTARTFARPR